MKRGSHGLVYPFFAGEELIGTLVVAKSPRANRYSSSQPGVVFTAGQTNVVATFANFLAIQIANNIKQSLLPKQLPPLPGFELAAIFTTC